MKCKHCKRKDECADDAFINGAEFVLETEHECAGFESFTNADRIRAMSDEELEWAIDPAIVPPGMSKHEWLQQPAETT